VGAQPAGRVGRDVHLHAGRPPSGEIVDDTSNETYLSGGGAAPPGGSRVSHPTRHSAPPSHAPAVDHKPKPVVEIDHLPPHWEPTPFRPKLPIGVALLSIVIAIAGIVIIVAGALYLLNSYLGAIVPTDLLIIRSVDILGAAILLLFGAVLIAMANALWHQERWSLWTTIIVVFGGLAYLFFTASITVLFLIFLLLFIYLLTVRRYFY
jgi:hypothetical protein